jgi:hypothetical protein
MKIEIHGRQVEVDDSFKNLSEDEQHKTIDEIASGFMPTRSEASAAQEAQQNAGPDVLSNIGAGAEAVGLRYGVGVPAVWGAHKIKQAISGAPAAAPSAPTAAAPSNLSGTERWRASADEINDQARIVTQNTNLRKKFPGFSRATPPPIPTSAQQEVLGKLGKALSHPASKAFTTGYNLMDVAEHAGEGLVGNVQAAASATAAAAPLIEKVLPKKYKPIAKAVQYGTPAVNYGIDKLKEQFATPAPEPQHFQVGGLAALAKKVPVKKYSDIIQNYIGKSLYPTIVDTTKLDLAAGKMAGPEAPDLQNISPLHKAEGWVFANDSMPAAKRLFNVNQRNDGNVVFTGLIGSPYQLKTNRSVFGDLTDEFYKAIAEGKLTPELLAKYQAAINASTYKTNKGMMPTFSEPHMFDIRDRAALEENSKLFHQRDALANMMGGSGPTGVPLGGKKGQIFDYEGVLNASRDPNTIGAPTQSIGTRLFTLNDRPPEYRPDLHNAFDYSLFGKDLGESFAPVPKEAGIPGAIETIRQSNIAKGKKPDVTSMHIARNILMQPINEDYVKAVQAAGFASGGSINGYAEGKSVLPNLSLDTRSIPSMSGIPGVGYMQTPQGAMARLQMEKELEDARIRAGVSGMAMAIPGQHGVRTMPGQMDIGANVPMGPGALDISANRSINPIPGRGHMQGVNARYTVPFAKGGKVDFLAFKIKQNIKKK